MSQIIPKLHRNGMNLSLTRRGAKGLSRLFKYKLNLIFKQLSAGAGRGFVPWGNRYPLLLTTVLSGGCSAWRRREQQGEVSGDEEGTEHLATGFLGLSLWFYSCGK